MSARPEGRPRARAGGIAPATLRPLRLLGALGCLGGAALVGLLVGPVGLGPLSVVGELLDRLPLVTLGSGLSEREMAILWELRMPRVVLGALVGGTLALAGAAYQGAFRNPLADPYLLGVAAGAGLGATLAFAYLPPTVGWPIDPVPLAAFVGALAGVTATYLLGSAQAGARTTTTLVLAGVAMASFLTAVQTYVQQTESQTLQRVYSWILGQLSTAAWNDVRLILPYVALSALGIVIHGRLLDVMSVGDEEADSLGIRATRVRLLVVLAASLGTAAAVAVSGLIGFVGIIVPHTLRLLFGSSYRLLLPLSLVLGGAFVILTDVMARTLLAPAELPIGVITAFFGAPFFVIVLRTSRRMS